MQSAESLHSEIVASDLRPAVEELAQALTQHARGALLGITLYGRCVSERFGGPLAAITSVAVVREIDIDVLRQIAEQADRLARLRVAAPLMMTPAGIAASRDTFPLELLEIQDFHDTLWGADHFSAIELAAEHVRLAVERELKQIGVVLRQAVLSAGGRDHDLSFAVEHIVERAMRALRGLLWLRGRRGPLDRVTVTAEVARIAAVELPGLAAAARQPKFFDFAAFRLLYDDIERLAKLSDGLR
ncbi:MAG: hypothetical protein U1A27_14160 [Phycisphaerae bacterium]